MANKPFLVVILTIFGCQLAVASVVHAGTIGFHNDTKIPVIVQGMSIVNNVVRQGRRHTLLPGAICFERIVAPGTKIFIVVDARQPTRVLFKGPINFAGSDQFFSIVGAETRPKKESKSSKASGQGTKTVKDPPLLSVDLVPTMAPMATPATPAPMIPPVRRGVSPPSKSR
jgi:hypothetical protein